MSSWSKKGTQVCYPFRSKCCSKRIPSRFPNGPYGERHPLTGHFYLSLNISLFIFPSDSPVRKPPPCSLTGSSWAAILRHLSHWSTFRSFFHSCMSARVPKGSPLTYGEKHNITIHGAPRRWKAYIQWGTAWFSKGIITTLLSLPQCHAAFSTIPSTLAWVNQSPVSQHVSWQPPSGYALHNCYHLPRDPG